MTRHQTSAREEDLHNFWERLVSRYGPSRAKAIYTGRDPEANADLAKWRNLGKR
jgi:hypothetical protein